ncbi:MAG: AAA family ATPase [Deltaproteobacteria bacterium]|jgi:hypothetical protein|nr:AAA family ATPase [Deltaproteobacteria bacterium]
MAASFNWPAAAEGGRACKEPLLRRHYLLFPPQYETAQCRLATGRCCRRLFQFAEGCRRTASPKTALLIDEYDAPVLSLIQRSELTFDERLAEKIREAVRSFYSMIKANDEILDLIFITGISRFSGMGAFSPINNLQDISTDPDFAAFLGLTRKSWRVISPRTSKRRPKNCG